MTQPTFVKPTFISLKGDPRFDERWVQSRLAEDPSLLGLGDVVLKDKERMQPRAGRLDLLLQDQDDDRRYEVEVQLGATDEAHIIRCIEYWDLERKRYPEYEHVAVLVAEDITSRFLNVVQLFNGHIPLIAIQMRALVLADAMTLHCTRVVDEQPREPQEEEEPTEAVDRQYWAQKVPAASLGIADWVLGLINKIDHTAKLNYNRAYIGLYLGHRVNNFVAFHPKQNFCKTRFRIPQSVEMDEEIKRAGLDLVGYKAWGAYEIRLSDKDRQNQQLIERLVCGSYEHFA